MPNVPILYFEDYAVGDTATTPARTITTADIVRHAGETGDFHAIHVDAEYARSQPAGCQIAHGTLILAIAAGLAMNLQPNESPALSYGYDRVRFIKPVYAGDTIHVETRVSDKREAKHPSQGLVLTDYRVLNQHAEVVLAFTHLLIVARR